MDVHHVDFADVHLTVEVEDRIAIISISSMSDNLEQLKVFYEDGPFGHPYMALHIGGEEDV